MQNPEVGACAALKRYELTGIGFYEQASGFAEDDFVTGSLQADDGKEISAGVWDGEHVITVHNV